MMMVRDAASIRVPCASNTVAPLDAHARWYPWDRRHVVPPSPLTDVALVSAEDPPRPVGVNLVDSI